MQPGRETNRAADPRESSGTALTNAYGPSVKRLVGAIQELSLARDLDTVMRVVREAARELTGADGATFVLRDGDLCFYADESAIAPLWKGHRFPMSACISGWVMLNRRPTVIPDIFQDERIPIDAYRPTFVKSLAMVPIRTAKPIGAIGNYWATRHVPSEEEVGLLVALADSTSIAMENVQLYDELERRVRDRTARLESANRELDAFCASVSHDLKSPLQSIGGYADLLQTHAAKVLGARDLAYLGVISDQAQRMSRMIDDLLRLSKVARAELRRERVDLSALAMEVVEERRRAEPHRTVEVDIARDVVADGDAGLLRIVLVNLFANAWKFTSRTERARIEFGAVADGDGGPAYVVRDNGVGFDMADATRLFGAFQRLHSQNEFPGTGIGLATVRRVVEHHGGRAWAESDVGRGAAVYFTLS